MDVQVNNEHQDGCVSDPLLIVLAQNCKKILAKNKNSSNILG